ncbi:hypothetical protein ACIQ9R_36220 [Streptomyces sp. NPDC094447]|uniref:hypothetical protein n=1 Tax=Streptomyces sp. NPDC094447 TaxID=3366062 RepID=UPI0038270CD1
MSNQAERDAVAALLGDDWKSFTAILDARGETWETTDAAHWPSGSALVFLDHGIRRLLAVAKIIGLDISRESLESERRAIQEWRRIQPTDPTLHDVVHNTPPAP